MHTLTIENRNIENILLTENSYWAFLCLIIKVIYTSEDEKINSFEIDHIPATHKTYADYQALIRV